MAPGGGRIDPEAFFRQLLGPDSRDLYADSHRELDRVLLPRGLEETGGNRLEAARRLGIGRETLRRRLRELDIHLTPRFEADEGDR
jgi:DNA-binding protein Fis